MPHCHHEQGLGAKVPGTAWHAGQKYKCQVCGAKYVQTWGTIIETFHRGMVYYMRAEIPDGDTLDINAMAMQRKYSSAKTPQELYDAIPVLNPMATSVMQPINAEKGVFKVVDRAFWASLPPKFKWADVSTFHNSLV